jgi:hypothetical protein
MCGTDPGRRGETLAFPFGARVSPSPSAKSVSQCPKTKEKPMLKTTENIDPLVTYPAAGKSCGCPQDQMFLFASAGVVLQRRQLAASAAARLCDYPDGPTEIGFGGSRGGGKSYWLLAQMGVDDCQRFPGLKCLLLRRVGKANIEWVRKNSLQSIFRVSGSWISPEVETSLPGVFLFVLEPILARI